MTATLIDTNSPHFACAYFYFDGQLFVGSHCIFIGEWQQADLIQSIWGIGNQLPKEDLKQKTHK